MRGDALVVELSHNRFHRGYEGGVDQRIIMHSHALSDGSVETGIMLVLRCCQSLCLARNRLDWGIQRMNIRISGSVNMI